MLDFVEMNAHIQTIFAQGDTGRTHGRHFMVRVAVYRIKRAGPPSEGVLLPDAFYVLCRHSHVSPLEPGAIEPVSGATRTEPDASQILERWDSVDVLHVESPAQAQRKGIEVFDADWEFAEKIARRGP